MEGKKSEKVLYLVLAQEGICSFIILSSPYCVNHLVI